MFWFAAKGKNLRKEYLLEKGDIFIEINNSVSFFDSVIVFCLFLTKDSVKSLFLKIQFSEKMETFKIIIEMMESFGSLFPQNNTNLLEELLIYI